MEALGSGGVRPITIGQVGLGRWGGNLARNFSELAELAWVCDLDRVKLEAHAERNPSAKTTTRLEDLLEDPRVEAVVVATPVVTHFELAHQALLVGKHVFVEKPMALSAVEAEALVEIARDADRVLMPGHLLLYHPGIVALRELVESGELGDVLYVYGNRLNLGTIRADENALGSLGAHDLSVILHLLDEEPVEVWARGESFLKPGVEDVVVCYLRFPSGTMATMHLSWLDPHKTRRITVVGTKKMAVFDDMELDRKVTVYDKAAEQPTGSYGEWQTRIGDIYSPRVRTAEPLRLECEHFLAMVRGGGEPMASAMNGLHVVRVLEQLQQSLERAPA